MRLLRACAVVVGTILAVAAAGPAARAERVALVIGNAAYDDAGALANPRTDAEAVAAALGRLGFQVELGIDLDQIGLRRALRDFGRASQRAEVALVYYAGHGLQMDGENFLLPVDARLQRERDLLYEALPLGLVIGEVAQAADLGIVILDACRDNPLAERMRQALGPNRADLVGRGLARIDQLPGDTLVAFSTRPGDIAEDGAGEHSPFTAALLEHIEEPGLELDLLFRRVRDDVLVRTARRQEPRTYDSLGADPFYFRPPQANRVPVVSTWTGLEVATAAGPTPLLQALPFDPDGDTLRARVAGLPARGEVRIGGRPLQRGDLLTMQELGRAVYRPGEADPGDAGAFDYLVQDDRGGTAFGRIAIRVADAPVSSPAPDPPVSSAAPEAVEPGQEEVRPQPPTGPPVQAIEAGLGLTSRDWRAVQRSLNRLGHEVGPVDGLPGPRTRRALAAWQRARGATPSGYLVAGQLAALRAPPAAGAGEPAVSLEAGAEDPMASPDGGSATQLAYVWAHDEEAASYVPSTLYNVGPDGTATVRRSGIGAYEVELGPLLEGPGVNVQVTGYGPDNAYCNLVGWGDGTAGVRCFAAGGQPGDASFSLLVVKAGPDDPDIAYALADRPTRASYAAPAETLRDGAGPVRISRTGTGAYALEFGDVAGIGANVQVSTLGAGGERCAVVLWSEGRVQVRCRSSTGQPVDAAFSVLVVRARGSAGGPADRARFAHVWAPERAEAEFRAPVDYTHDADEDIRVTRSRPGRYVVRLGPVIGERGGNAQATAYGTGSQYCKVERWFGESVEIGCFDPAGRPANAPFSLLFARAAGD